MQRKVNFNYEREYSQICDDILGWRVWNDHYVLGQTFSEITKRYSEGHWSSIKRQKIELAYYKKTTELQNVAWFDISCMVDAAVLSGHMFKFYDKRGLKEAADYCANLHKPHFLYDDKPEAKVIFSKKLFASYSYAEAKEMSDQYLESFDISANEHLKGMCDWICDYTVDHDIIRDPVYVNVFHPVGIIRYKDTGYYRIMSRFFILDHEFDKLYSEVEVPKYEITNLIGGR